MKSFSIAKICCLHSINVCICTITESKLINVFLTFNGTVLHWIVQSSTTGSVNKSTVKHI